ncbi:MAG: glycosyltransferase [Chloroflexia bacterium]
MRIPMIPGPLVTFTVLSYNQEKYIREAAESALAQTYSPLVVAFSDDASSDQTYAIVCEVCAAYRGPHTIRHSRNAVNLGLSAHIALANERAEGELIVWAAGDDISVSDRTQRLVDAYLQSGRRSHYFYSLVTAMTEDGVLQGAYQSPGHKAASSVVRVGLANYPIAIGASQAWTKHLATYFAPMSNKIWAEDQVYGFRGVLLGPVTFVDRPLVNYRSGAGLSSTPRPFNLQRYLRNQVNVIRMYRQRAVDAFAARRPWLGIVVAVKAFMLGLLFPLSPFFSVLRRIHRVRGR